MPKFLSPPRMRSLQPMPGQHGVASRALASLREVFDHARDAMRKNPGCAAFASLVTAMLNVEIRPVTAKWHGPMEAGILDSRDGSDEFRADLAELQSRLRPYAEQLHMM